jgi:hypothetical protein
MKEHEWPDEWIRTAEDLVRRKFEAKYASKGVKEVRITLFITTPY